MQRNVKTKNSRPRSNEICGHAHVTAVIKRRVMVARLCLLALGLAPTRSALLHAPSFRAFATAPARSTPVVCAEGETIKSALSSYMHFCGERRSGLTSELKAKLGAEFKNTLVMSGLGAEWKALGDAEKARFTAIAQADKERFDAAVAANPELKPKKKKAKKTGGPKKLSAYMHFCADRRPAVTAALKESMGSEFKVPAVMTALGAAWKALSDAEKAPFQEMAAKPIPDAGEDAAKEAWLAKE